MANRFEAHDGRIVSADLLSEYSFDLFQTDLHLDSSERIAKHLGFQGIEFKVATNFLFLKSLRARKLTVLRWLVSREVEQVRSVTSDFEIDLPIRCEKIVREVSTELFFTRKQAVVFACKVFLHRLFRVFGGRHVKNFAVTRAWVEVSEALYPDAFEKSHVLIYPFSLNLLRQVKFALRAFRIGRNVSFAGIPYSLRGLLLPFFSPHLRFQQMIRFETEAYVQHAREFIQAKVKVVRTSDEFEIAAVALYEMLSRDGIVSTNTAHGVGNYGPFQAYSKFAVLNESQADFYRLRNAGLSFEVHSQTNTRHVSVSDETASAASLASVTLVHIHQNFVDLGLAFEERIQRELIERLKLIAEVCQIRMTIKAHPNLNERHMSDLRDSTGVVVVKQLPSELTRPIFLTLNSTAYFDFRKLGPVLFFRTNTLNPSVYFGNEIETVNETSLQPRIEALMEVQEWVKARNAKVVNEDSP